MFTGIIEAIGHVEALEPKAVDMRLRINTGSLDLNDVALGDSIATNGVCLTVIELPGNGFWADVSGETLSKTGLGQLKTGDPVNLEKALTPTTRLGGHMVSGHVDGIGEVFSKQDDGRSIRFRIHAPQELAKYIAARGSICVDGISLTVTAVDGCDFDLNIVPHTLQETTMSHFENGSKVNLEVDIIARHLERLLQGENTANNQSTINMSFLAENGFIK